MEILKTRNEELPRKVCYDTLEMVGQRDRYDNLMTGPLRIFFEAPLQSVYEFNLEFLSTFSLKKDIENMFDNEPVTFQCGGTW
ncbi:hypothetical protein Hanom_Chr10g00910591 [Helianthus anomalus]